MIMGSLILGLAFALFLLNVVITGLKLAGHHETATRIQVKFSSVLSYLRL